MPANEILALAMFVAFIALVFTGFPVAWILAGLAVLFTALAIVFEADFELAIGVDWAYASLSVERVWNVMENWVMVALPMFIFMGLLLDRSGIAEPADDEFRAIVRARPRRTRGFRRPDRRIARRDDRHHRRLGGAAGAAWVCRRCCAKVTTSASPPEPSAPSAPSAS